MSEIVASRRADVQIATPTDRASRLLDQAVALLGLWVLLPLIALIVLAIWAESGSPILFIQKRIGLNGRPFRMLKFRKFRRDCDSFGSPLTVKGDARMTRVGRLLAKTKFDEIPQLVNVLRGEMSLVGPRPETLVFADCFSGRFEELLDYKPGLFGPAQVEFRHEDSMYPIDTDPVEFYRSVLFARKACMDLAYYPSRTLSSDIGWIIRGMIAVAGMGASSRDGRALRSENP